MYTAAKSTHAAIVGKILTPIKKFLKSPEFSEKISVISPLRLRFSIQEERYMNNGILNPIGNTPLSYTYGEQYPVPPQTIFAPTPTLNHATSCITSDGTLLYIEKHSYDNNNREHIRKKAVCNNIQIVNVTDIVIPDSDRKNIGSIANYYSGSSYYSSFIPAADNDRKWYGKNMKGVKKAPAATNSELNNVLEILIKECPNKNTVFLFPHQGFFYNTDGSLWFAYPPDIQGLPDKVIPESIKKRRYYPYSDNKYSNDLMLEAFIRVLSNSNSLQIGGLYMLLGLYLPLLPQELKKDIPFLNLIPSDGVPPEKIAALLCTNDLYKYPVLKFSDSPQILQKELEQVYDGVAVIIDDCFADEEDRIKNVIKTILRSQKNAQRLIVTVSDKIGFLANYIEENSCISLSTEGVNLSESTKNLTEISGYTEAIFVNLIRSNNALLKQKIIQYKEIIFEAKTEEQTSVTKFVNILTIIAACSTILTEKSIISTAELDELRNKLNNYSDTSRTFEDLILAEFGVLLSQEICSGKYKIVGKHNRMKIDIDNPPIIVANSRPYILKTILSNVASSMKQTNNYRNVINVLERYDVLNPTDSHTRPITAYNPEGNPIRIYGYDIDPCILNIDALELIESPDSSKVFIDPEDILVMDFLPLIKRPDGKITGRRMRYSDIENNSIAIWGQSGYGKTTMMSEIAKGYAALGHCIVIFDSGNSFTNNSLKYFYNDEFINENINIIDLGKDDFPVDIFKVNDEYDDITRENILFDLLLAGVREFTIPQTNALKNALSQVIKSSSNGEQILPIDIINEIDRADCNEDVKSSLKNRLQPLMRAIIKCGMENRNWKEYMSTAKPITIIRTCNNSGEKGNAIFDMLIASLFNAQYEDSSVALDIFVDELQNQNCSENSPIRKLLKEGRKIHLSFVGATQDFYPRNTEIGSTMGKADTHIFLKPTQNSISLVAKELNINNNDVSKLENMKKFVCFIKGTLYSPDEDMNTSITVKGRLLNH